MSVQAAALYALVSVSGAQQSIRDLQNVSGQVNRTQGTLGALAKNAGQVGHGMVQVGQGLLRIGEVAALAAGGAVAASAKIGTSFQAMTELIHTQAGASQGEVNKMRLGIQAMVHAVGTTPGELAAGLYHIESVGVRGSAALDILKASALGAKVGLADMESVTNALTAVWFSGIKGAKSMTDAMAILDGIVGVGNMHLQDLTDSFKSGVLGTAATYSVDIRSLGAAIATLTDAGVPANIAATRLNMTLTHMAAPIPKAINVLKGLGISQFQLAYDLRKPDGIFVALKDLHDHLVAAGEIKNGILTPKGAADLSKIFGGSRFGATAMQLLTAMDRVQQKYELITRRSQTFGQNVAATMQTAGFKFGQLKADIEESALAFSDGFLPALARAGTKLDGFLMGHQGDIRRMGVQLGQWIDKIDWKTVENGANSFVDVLKSMLDIISKVPPQIDLAIVGFLGLNKLSGGLLGKGAENIVGGLLGGLGTIGKAGLRGILGKIPVIGGAAAALTSTPVFVTNWPVGFGIPGGGGVPPVVAAAGGGVVAAAAGAGLLLGTGAMLGELEQANVSLAQIKAGAFKVVIPGLTDRPSAWSEFIASRGVMPSALPVADQLASAVSTGDQETASQMRNAARMSHDAAQMDAESASQQRNAAFTMSHAVDKWAADQAKANSPAQIRKDLAATLAGIERRSMAKYHWASGKPPESWVMGTFGRDLLRYARDTLNSHKSAAQKIADLEHLEKVAVAAKDWGVARKLEAAIEKRRAMTITLEPQKTELIVDGDKLAVSLSKRQQWGRAI